MSIQELVIEDALKNLSFPNALVATLPPSQDSSYKRLVASLRGDDVKRDDRLTHQRLLDDTLPFPSPAEMKYIRESGKWLSRLNYVSSKRELNSPDYRLVELRDLRCSVILNRVRKNIVVTVTSNLTELEMAKLCLEDSVSKISSSNILLETVSSVSNDARELFELIKPSLNTFLRASGGQLPLVFTGYSKGGAVARVMRYLFLNHLAHGEVPRHIISSVVTFGCPAVFNKEFCKEEKLGIHFCISKDIYPRLKVQRDSLEYYEGPPLYVAINVAVLCQDNSIRIVKGNSETMSSIVVDEIALAVSPVSKGNSLKYYSKFFER